MRWEDERYVRVYTRDTGDWLDLSFEAQALFLLLLRKVDRIGELRLGKRGKAAVPALVGHPTREALVHAMDELLADGCVALSGEGQVLLIPNFHKAQETAKSTTERKREQRSRDAELAAAASRMSRDNVTERDTRDCHVTGHEMSPRAVPSVPCRAVPPGPAVTEAPPNSVGAMSGIQAPPAITQGAVEDRRKAPRPEPGELQDRMGSAWFDKHGVAYDWPSAEELAIGAALGKAGGDEALVLARWRKALEWTSFPICGSVADLVKHWNRYGTDPPEKRKGGKDPRNAPVRAEDIPKSKFASSGRVDDF